MRYLVPLSILITALLASPGASLTAQGAGEQSFELSLKEHKFSPQELTIPADKRVKLTIKNLDATPAMLLWRDRVGSSRRENSVGCTLPCGDRLHRACS